MKNMEHKYAKLYKRAWKKLNKATPLRYDCGKLCDKRCCSGTDNDGMLLFPGEEHLYLNKDWCLVKETGITLSDGYIIKLLVCKGTCPREERPLSCRIFPVIPYLNEHNMVDFRLDPRSFPICPVSAKPEEHPLESKFINSLYRAFPLLLDDDRVVEFIKLLSGIYDDIVDIWEKYASN
ncbi:MAG TPA: hypothetical protein VIL05_04080 [Thermoclostridium sp.]